MPFKSSKAQDGALTTLVCKFDGGINYSESPSQIADNEMVRALNIIYNSQTGTPEVRPGTTCVTASALPASIRKIAFYEKSSTESWLVAVSGRKLYYLDGSAWVEIGTDVIADTAVIPSFLTFNTCLLIADGSTNLRKWDGTSLTSLADGLNATAIIEIGARVVVNSAVDPDLVTFSGVEDETMWNTADLTNPAVGLRAGFGDNMSVNGFAVFGSELLVSKRGDSEKYIYRINTSDVPTNWVVSKLTANNAAQNAHTLCAAFNNVFLVDSNGFKSIQGVTQYGDLQVDIIGSKVNTAIGNQPCYDMAYLPAFTAVWYIVPDLVYCYHRLQDMEGIVKHAFTSIQFQQGGITSVIQAGDTVYLAGENGYLYRFGDANGFLVDTDEVTPGVEESYPSLLVSKRFNIVGNALLRRTSLAMKALENTTITDANLRVSTAERDRALLHTFRIKKAAQDLYDATEDLADADTLLADMSNYAWVESTRNRIRGSSLQFQIDSEGGRYGVENLQAEIAVVGG